MSRTPSKQILPLILDEKNKLSLNEIQSSLFVVCLDRTMPKSGNDNRQTTAGKQFIHGGGSSGNAANRWYDKTVQVRDLRYLHLKNGRKSRVFSLLLERMDLLG